MIIKIFDTIRDFLTFVAQIGWLKDALPISLIKRSRRLRILIWRQGEYRELRSRFRREGKTLLHFLHIGKTGGTAIMAALKDNHTTDAFQILVTPHPFTLKDVPVGDKFAFVLRDPAARFVSGFNNRKMQGKPSYEQPWTRNERKAFVLFKDANELASMLSSKNPKMRKQARRAMRNIEHVNTSIEFWLGDIEYLSSRMDDLLWFGFQEQLDEDFSNFVDVTGLPNHVSLPRKNSKANRGIHGLNKHLDDRAIKNLKKWYSVDYDIYEICEKFHKEQIATFRTQRVNY